LCRGDSEALIASRDPVPALRYIIGRGVIRPALAIQRHGDVVQNERVRAGHIAFLGSEVSDPACAVPNLDSFGPEWLRCTTNDDRGGDRRGIAVMLDCFF
jgi:hypothetical protein